LIYLKKRKTLRILGKNLNFSVFMKSHVPTTPINRAFQKSGFSKVVRVYFENQQNNFCSKTQNFLLEKIFLKIWRKLKTLFLKSTKLFFRKNEKKIF